MLESKFWNRVSIPKPSQMDKIFIAISILYTEGLLTFGHTMRGQSSPFRKIFSADNSHCPYLKTQCLESNYLHLNVNIWIRINKNTKHPNTYFI